MQHRREIRVRLPLVFVGAAMRARFKADAVDLPGRARDGEPVVATFTKGSDIPVYMAGG